MKLIGNLAYHGSGQLCFDQIPLEDLAGRFGTPLFVASRRRIEANVERFFKAFSSYPEEVILSYSCKTNSNLGVLQVLKETKAVAGVCSGLDYVSARSAGFPPGRIFFDGIHKRPEDLRRAVDENIGIINAESWEELKRIDEYAAQAGAVARVGLRIRIGDRGFHFSVKSLMGIGYDRFGFDLHSGIAAQMVDRVQSLKNIRICGVLVHEGSHYLSAKPYLKAFRQIMPVIRKIARLSPGQFEYLNLGGGLGVPTVKPYQLTDLIRNTMLRLLKRPVSYELSARELPLEKMASEIIEAVTLTFKAESIPLPKLVFEPGRYVTGDAFVLLAKVVLRKEVPRSGTWLVLDAGTNLFPYLLSFNEYHQIMPLKKSAGPYETVHFSGPLLYSSDLVMKNAHMPNLREGDLVAILDAGAYTLAYSNQFLYPRPGVILIDKDQTFKTIRQPETPENVLAQDRTF